MYILLAFIFLLALMGVAHTEDFICEDSVTIGKYRRYVHALDPTFLVLQPNETCNLIFEADTPDQQAKCLDGQATPATIPFKYRMVSSGLCAEMPQSGTGSLTKDAVD